MNEDNRSGKKGRLRFEPMDETSGQLGPKSKPGAKRRRKALADPKNAPPIIDTSDTSPLAEDTPATSGQIGPKSEQGGNLRQDSEKARPSERLRRDGDPTPDSKASPHDSTAPKGKKAVKADKKLNKSKLCMEKTGGKLDKARNKLEKQKQPKKPSVPQSIGRAANIRHGSMYMEKSIRWSMKM